MNQQSNTVSGQPVDKSRYRELLDLAKKAMKQTYSPYSSYPVGAAAMMADGTVFTGCNVENANFTGTICAERTAFVKAISEGHRDFRVVAVACESAIAAWPCGQCRQFMAEFGEHIVIIVEGKDGSIEELTMGQLLPERIKPHGSDNRPRNV
jgi:cytidine deaminase